MAASGFGMADAWPRPAQMSSIWGTNSESKNEDAVKQLKAHGKRVAARKVNVARERSRRRAWARPIKEMGRVDTVIANAGIGRRRAVVQPDDARDLAPGARRQRGRRVLHTCARRASTWSNAQERATQAVRSSVSQALPGIEGAGRNEAYSATKGAVLAMVRSIAVEHARFGIRANSIAPGWIATEMTAGGAELIRLRGESDPARTDAALG